MKRNLALAGLMLFLALLQGCTLLRTDMVPKPVWYWSAEAKHQRAYDAVGRQQAEEWIAPKR